MISKLSVRNFKCLRNVEIDFERFTVLVGPNGSGKSSVLKALELLCRAFAGQQGTVDPELSFAVSKGSNDSVDVATEVSGNGAYRYRTLSQAHAGMPVLAQSWSGEGPGFAAHLDSMDWERWTANRGNPPTLPLAVLLRLETSKLLSTNMVADPTAMAPDGSGLHSALANMALNDPDSWQQLQVELRRIIPSIRRLRHSTTAMHQPAALLFDTIGGDSLPASQVSEGTLLVLGLLAALHAPGRPNLVLLDDLDRGLHPRAQKELISLLRGLLDTNNHPQIIATTHSPYLLDSMYAKEVRMILLGDDGATVCAPLAAHPQFQKWKDEMTPGEMWSLFGEKWLVEHEAPV